MHEKSYGYGNQQNKQQAKTAASKKFSSKIITHFFYPLFMWLSQY